MSNNYITFVLGKKINKSICYVNGYMSVQIIWRTYFH